MQGGCFCGHVRYEATGPFNETICHCATCRRTTGAPVVAWFTVARTAFRLMSGSPVSFRSSDHGERTFCPACGTPLTFASTRSPGELDVTTCSLDEPASVPPHDHTWTASRVGWVRICDELPAYVQGRKPAQNPKPVG